MDSSSNAPQASVDSKDIHELNSLAIEAALKCDWETAINLNSKIIEEEPKNTASLNRLAHALFEQGKFQQSKKIYHQVLEIDPYNEIAQKNLKKISSFKKGDGVALNNHPINAISPDFFIAEPGTVQTINLTKLAEPQKLSTLSPGIFVNLLPKNRGLSVTDGDNFYLGALPDDIAHLLLKLIKGGNKYQAIIRSVKPNSLTVMVRETFRSKKFKKQPSFINNTQATTYSSKHIYMLPDELGKGDTLDEAEEESTD